MPLTKNSYNTYIQCLHTDGCIQNCSKNIQIINTTITVLNEMKYVYKISVQPMTNNFYDLL